MLEQHKADQIKISNLKSERNLLLKVIEFNSATLDAQDGELNFLRRAFNTDEALIRKYHKKGVFND